MYLQHILYLRQPGCEDPWLFFEDKRDPRAKKMFGKHRLSRGRLLWKP